MANETKQTIDTLMQRRQAISGRKEGAPQPVAPPESKPLSPPKKKKSEQLSLWEQLLRTLWGE